MKGVHYSMEKVTIIGGGNGAFAAAADLTLRGSQVTLFELPRFVDGLSEVIQRGGIEMEAFPGNGLEARSGGRLCQAL